MIKLNNSLSHYRIWLIFIIGLIILGAIIFWLPKTEPYPDTHSDTDINLPTHLSEEEKLMKKPRHVRHVPHELFPCSDVLAHAGLSPCTEVADDVADDALIGNAEPVEELRWDIRAHFPGSHSDTPPMIRTFACVPTKPISSPATMPLLNST